MSKGILKGSYIAGLCLSMMLLLPCAHALAAGTIDIRNTRDVGLAVRFGVAGMLTLLSAFMIVHHWYRPGWYREWKRKLSAE